MYRLFFSFAPLNQQYLFRSFGSLLRLPFKLNFINFMSSVSGRCGSETLGTVNPVNWFAESVVALGAPRRATGGRYFRPLAWAAGLCLFFGHSEVKDEDVCHPDR